MLGRDTIRARTNTNYHTFFLQRGNCRPLDVPQGGYQVTAEMLYALIRRQGSKEIAESENACTVFGTSHTGQRKMIPKKTPLFAPCAFNLAETSRMVEIAKAVQTNFSARGGVGGGTDLRRRRDATIAQGPIQVLSSTRNRPLSI